MKLKDWLKSNKSAFADRDLRFLIKDLFEDSSFLDIEEKVCLDSECLSRLSAIKKSYTKGMPMAYILGKEVFFGLEFKVNPYVLIPRPETELIVEEAIKTINKNKLKSVLDLCTGSGNIGISIVKEVPKDLFIISSDISFKALGVAKGNTKVLSKRLNFVCSDLLTAFKGNSFDLIISNPPYVEDKNLQGSLKYEPEIALKAGKNGLSFIKRILSNAYKYLKDEGYLIIEVGYNHKYDVDKLLTKQYELVKWIKDYSGYFRGLVLKKASSQES